MDKKKYKLEDYVSLRTVQRFQDDFVKMMRFSIKVMDINSKKSLTEETVFEFGEIYKYFIDCAKCTKECYRHYLQAERTIENEKEFYTYNCNQGFANIIIPIVLNGCILAFIVAGPIRIATPASKDADRKARELDLATDQYLINYLSLPLFDKESLDFIGGFLKTAFNVIASNACLRITEKDQFEKMNNLNKGLTKEISVRGQKLEIMEDQYLNLINNLPDIIYSVDENDLFISISSAVQEILGYSSRDLIGRTFLKIVHPEEVDKLKNAYNEALAGQKKLIGFRFRAVSNKGEVKHLELNSFRTFDDMGKLEKIEGVMRDVTNQCELSDKLRFSEEKYRSLVENARDIIYTVNKEGIITSINEEAEKCTGIFLREIIGKSFDRFIHPDDRPMLITSFLEIVNKKRDGSNNLQFRILDKDGKSITVLLNSRGIFDEKGNFLMIEGVLRDISKELKLEKEILKANERFKALFDSLQEAVYMADMEGKLLMVNTKLSLIFGFRDKNEMIGRYASEFYHDPYDRDLMMKEISEKGYVKDFVALMKKKDGNNFYIKINTGVIINEQGEYIGIQGIVTDVTKEINLEQELSRLKQMERNYLSLKKVKIEQKSNKI